MLAALLVAIGRASARIANDREDRPAARALLDLGVEAFVGQHQMRRAL